MADINPTAVRWQRADLLAARQYGVISREQLRNLGFSDGAVTYATSTGRLHRVFRGTYSLGRRGVGERGRSMAASLACGGGAVISHRSAAALFGLLDKGPVVVDVIAPGDRGRGIDGIRFHRVRPPRAGEVTKIDGIPCTTIARTLVDLAGMVGDRTLSSAFERAAKQGKLDIPAIEAATDPGRCGIRSLRKLTEEWRRAAAVSRKRRLKSPLEAKVLPLVIQKGLPAPLTNAPVQLANGRIEVDFLWPDQRFVLEADSRDFHGTGLAFERDRWRDRELLRAGYATLRVTSLQAETEAEEVAATIAARVANGSPLSVPVRSATRSVSHGR
jgi:very-short-patch-repair endonuclease